MVSLLRSWSTGALALVLLVPSGALSQSVRAGIATLEARSGGVSVIREGVAQAVTPGMALLEEDVVVTRAGRATVRFTSDGTIVRVGPDSRVQIDESAKERDVTVFFGRVWAHVVRAQERLSRFRSRGTIAAIRGTEISLGVSADEDETRLAVLEGRVEASNDAGQIELGSGESAVVRAGAAPVAGTRVKPQDAVQWALYYPPVLVRAGEDIGEGPWQQGVRAATAAYEKGDLQGAIDAITAVEEQLVQDPRFFTERAALRLAAGAAEAASRDIAHALELAPGDARALSLETVMAVAALDTPKALESGRKAVEADPSSAVAQVALSYAKQAAFDLDGARAALDRAVELDAKDALAWARLAELRSSQGRIDEALAAARKAAELRPDLSRTQTVLGFAYLLQLHVADATAAFEKAIAADADDPLPRLGKGLALIRNGHVDAGSKEMEVAVSLDPGASVIRSYLGKAYYESKRSELALRELELGKENDPNDPTPWFYEAIALQTTNRPGEALESLQKAMELNEGRAVYRSRLLLDSDLAARSASLGRVYADLGFQDRALVEGWMSVNADPTSFSAHRFLADSYSSMPRHEVARVSELFQSQMLQPLNVTPIQPRLGESNQLLMSAGPTALSFNEFNPLFSRNGPTLQASGFYGTQSSWSGEAVGAGIQDRFAWSVGYSRFQSDGWRTNADGQDSIASAFLQMEASTQTSLQLEYRYRDVGLGDLQQRFFDGPEWVNTSLTNDESRHTMRVGARHAFDPGSMLLVSLIGQDLYSSTRNEFDGFACPDTDPLCENSPPEPLKQFIRSTVPQRSYGAEAQHLWRSRWFNLTTGAGAFQLDGENRAEFGAVGAPGEKQPTIPVKTLHVNAYAYANLKPMPSLVFTAGASLDHLTGDGELLTENDVNQVNPKVGAMWTVLPGTVLRAAALRTLKRTLVTDQTLEPTQVAGFNQFFDDSDLTGTWRYGGGIDQKITSGTFVGVEYSQRDLTVPVIEIVPQEDGSVLNERIDATWDEQLARAYLFLIPHRWVGLRLQYVFSRFHADELPAIGESGFKTAGFRYVETHRAPVGVTFFHPSGLGASFTATWWRQNGTFENLLTGALVNGTSRFWLFDAGLSFRMPDRYGVFSVVATNLGDENFRYFEVDPENPFIVPQRAVFAKLTVAVP